MNSKDYKALEVQAKKTNKQYRKEKERRDTEKRIKAARKLVGRVLRYRNCYSCPEKASDYWWLYLLVKGIDKDGWLICEKIEIDSRGSIRIWEDSMAPGYITDGWQPTTKSMLRKLLAKIQRRLNSVNKEIKT